MGMGKAGGMNINHSSNATGVSTTLDTSAAAQADISGSREMHWKVGESEGLVPKPPRWDQSYFEKEITRQSDAGAKKLWICGPPMMQENFDKAAGSKYRNKIHVL